MKKPRILFNTKCYKKTKKKTQTHHLSKLLHHMVDSSGKSVSDRVDHRRVTGVGSLTGEHGRGASVVVLKGDKFQSIMNH